MTEILALFLINDNKLLWIDQIGNAISKAASMIAWITRNVISREKKLNDAHIYKSVIRPHLEYCIQIRSPFAQHGNWSMVLE